MKHFSRLMHDTRGVSAIEYCLLASFIALGLFTAVQQTGTKVAGSFEDAQAGFSAGEDPDGPGKGKKKGKKK